MARARSRRRRRPGAAAAASRRGIYARESAVRFADHYLCGSWTPRSGDQIWIVSYESDTGARRNYAYDRATKTATLLFSERSKFESLKLAKMRPIAYSARDGLTLHGYLTLPVGAEKNLPTVLLVHGGPWTSST